MLAFIDEVASRLGMLFLRECSSNREHTPANSIASFDQRNLGPRFLELHRSRQTGQACPNDDDLRASTYLMDHNFFGMFS
jgi:hypothetical protein